MAKKKVIIILIVAVIIVGGYFLAHNPGTDRGKPYTIGVILPLSGDLASLGEAAKKSAELAERDLPGGMREQLSVIFEDDRFDPKTTISAFNKLVGTNKADAIICFGSGPCSAVAPLADKQSIPLIAIASALVQKDKDFVVRLELNTVEEAKRLLIYIEERNYQRIASIIAVQEGIQSSYTALADDTDFTTREIASESVAPDLKDFRTPIAKILATKPDVILVGLLPGRAGEFGKQVRTLGYTGDLVGFNFIEGEETLVAAQGNLDGIVYTQVADPQNWFAEQYETAYHQSIGPGSAHIYDAITLIARAVAQSKYEPDEIISFLTSVKNFSGALGTYSSTDTHEFTLPIILKTIQNGQFTRLTL